MSKANHTPGPWFIFGNGHCVGGPSDGTDNGTAGVAMCAMRLRNPAEAQANATLIAAAPDLLSACKGALAHCQELRDAWERGALSDGMGGTLSNRNVDVCMALEKVVASAEGRVP